MGALGRVEGEGGPRVSLTNFEFRYTLAQGRSPCDVPGASLVRTCNSLESIRAL